MPCQVYKDMHSHEQYMSIDSHGRLESGMSLSKTAHSCTVCEHVKWRVSYLTIICCTTQLKIECYSGNDIEL